MSKSYLIASGKGGVGKSTLSAALGAAFAKRGKRVLIIDMDMGMRNMDIVLGVRQSVRFNLYDAVKKRCSMQMALIAIPENPGLYLLPSADLDSIKDIDKDELKRFSERVKKEFDIILIDAPSGVEKSFKAALRIAMNAIVITTPDGASVGDCINCADYLEKRGYDRPLLVVNRLREDWISEGSMPSAREVALQMQLPLLGTIPEDDMIYRASLRGENPTNVSSVLLGAASDMAARLCGEKRTVAVSPVDDKQSASGSELPVHPDLLAALRELEAQTSAALAQQKNVREEPVREESDIPQADIAPEAPKTQAEPMAEANIEAETEAKIETEIEAAYEPVIAEKTEISSEIAEETQVSEETPSAPPEPKLIPFIAERRTALMLGGLETVRALTVVNGDNYPKYEIYVKPKPVFIPFIPERKRALSLIKLETEKALEITLGEGYPEYTVYEKPKPVLVPFAPEMKPALNLGGLKTESALSVTAGEGYSAYAIYVKPKPTLVPFIAERKSALLLNGEGEVRALAVIGGEGYPAYTILEKPKPVLIPFTPENEKALSLTDGEETDAVNVQNTEDYPLRLPLRRLNILTAFAAVRVSALALTGGLLSAYPISGAACYPQTGAVTVILPQPLELPEEKDGAEAVKAAELTDFEQGYINAGTITGEAVAAIPLNASQQEMPAARENYCVGSASCEESKYAPGHPLERPAESASSYSESDAPTTTLPAEYAPKKHRNVFIRFLFRLFGIEDD